MTGSSPEEQLVPYRASTFEARRVLVFAPHADDEVFGCGAALASLAARGAAVTVVVLTDGAGDIADAGERRRIAATRLAESRAALAALGGGEVREAGFRDRGLGDDAPRLRAALAREIAAVRPDLVFVPSPVEIHPDHRALAAAFVALAADGGAGARGGDRRVLRGVAADPPEFPLRLRRVRGDEGAGRPGIRLPERRPRLHGVHGRAQLVPADDASRRDDRRRGLLGRPGIRARGSVPRGSRRADGSVGRPSSGAPLVRRAPAGSSYGCSVAMTRFLVWRGKPLKNKDLWGCLSDRR